MDRKQIRSLEIAGIVASPIAAYFVYRYSQVLMRGPLANAEGIGGIVLAMILIGLIPGFLSVFVASLPQASRYRIVNASLATFVVIALNVLRGARMIEDFQSFVIWCVLFACALGAALAATQAWKAIGAATAKKAATEPAAAPAQADAARADAAQAAPASAPPRPSGFLSALAVGSIPIVIVNVIASSFVAFGISAALLFVLFQLPRIPVFLIVAAALVPLAALWASAAAIVAIFRGGRSSQAAVSVPKESMPELYALAEEVARLVGAKAADRIILHLFPTFFVTQGKVELFDGEASGRVLALGMPVVGKLSGRELRSVLAHEFAHFAGGDLAYSAVVAPAYRALGTALEKLSKATAGGGTGAVMSILRLPSMLFLANSYEYFATIERVLSRGREYRADRVAADLYGKRSFVSALESVSTRSELFGKVADSIKPATAAAFFSEVDSAIDASSDAADAALAQLRAQTEDPLDTHPSFASRAAMLPDVEGSVPQEATASVPSFEAEGSRLSELAVAKLGIALAGSEEEAEEE